MVRGQSLGISLPSILPHTHSFPKYQGQCMAIANFTASFATHKILPHSCLSGNHSSSSHLRSFLPIPTQASSMIYLIFFSSSSWSVDSHLNISSVYRDQWITSSLCSSPSPIPGFQTSRSQLANSSSAFLYLAFYIALLP